MLVTESAGLCGRCAPHIRGIPAVCVIDCLSGITAPFKAGPMLKYADFIAVTKGDLVSPAEREVFLHYIHQANPRARVSFMNGLTGQGAYRLADDMLRGEEIEEIRGKISAVYHAGCSVHVLCRTAEDWRFRFRREDKVAG